MKGDRIMNPATGMDAILAQTTNITTLMGDIFTLMTSNAYLCFFLAVALLGAAVHVFKVIKSV